uniref:Isoleucine--tRNA ligase, mitochondrial n=1 Tax=Cladonia uncialis subsp. uncialis TaxID=180999 RepID=A0A2K9YDP2_CLAUC|nr:putative isoleucyl-tRNA synthetase [Cladonia uncialis subsp. uncialis]
MNSLRPIWKKTLHLPKASFPPRAVVADRPKYIKRCTDDLYKWQRNLLPRDRPGFTLADGPPYANGSLHIGHALNKILKDIICRYNVSEGTRVDWIPGWDCHGLPIELKALQEQEQGPHSSKINGAANPVSVRNAARKLALKTVEQQKRAFWKWGIMADWDNAWKTMDKRFEIKQLEVFKEMVKKGLIYRRFKPVYWSPSSRTALAEAELEYRDDHVSTAAYVKYPMCTAPEKLRNRLLFDMKTVSAVIWTTTPWTLPANRAIGFHKDIEYIVAESAVHGRLLFAASRLPELEHQLEEALSTIITIDGEELLGATYDSPVFDTNSSARPFLHASFVSETSGSGLVHLAPGHGMDDYELCLKQNIPAFAPLDDKGCFTNLAWPEEADHLVGIEVLGAGNRMILDQLSHRGYILTRHKYEHRYPYDWRSKQPVLIRATEQWFANVGNIQGNALQALDNVTFIPPSGKTRLEAFVKNRTEWCISRQRAWGLPIPALYHKETNEAILTEDSVAHIISIVQKRGVDAWWTDAELDPEWTPPFLRNSNDQAVYLRGKDTMDVWFDSGTSWTQTERHTKDDRHVASCYIEGTDQHRGWFQSSLLTFVAYQSGGIDEQVLPKAPFRTLITHGFTLDQEGRKMSKSIGNVVSPDEIMNGSLLPPTKKKVKGNWTEFRDAMGPDGLRLWVASCDYTTDIKVSQTMLQAINGSLSKYRVTFKLMLGILADFNPRASLIGGDHPNRMHKIALRQLEKVSTSVHDHYRRYEFSKATSEIISYINTDLSSFYFECIKDAAYCGTSSERSHVQRTIYQIFIYLQQMLVPITPLLVEELWDYTPKEVKEWNPIPPSQRSWKDLNPLSLEESSKAQLDIDVMELMKARAAIKGAQELSRNDKNMGDSLQSYVLFDIEAAPSQATNRALDLLIRYGNDLEDILGVSKVSVHDNRTLSSELSKAQWSYPVEFDIFGQSVKARVYEPQLAKCVRCWKFKAPVTIKEEALCERCESVVGELRLSKPELSETHDT